MLRQAQHEDNRVLTLSLSKGEAMPGKEIYVEFIVMGNTVKVTAIDSESGLEASVLGPANAPRRALAEAARKKLEYVARKQG